MTEGDELLDGARFLDRILRTLRRRIEKHGADPHLRHPLQDREQAPQLRARLEAARADPDALARKEEAELLIALGPCLDSFLARLFGIERELGALKHEHERLAGLYTCKRQFVQRKAMHRHPSEEAETFDGDALARQLETAMGAPLTELAFAQAVTA